MLEMTQFKDEMPDIDEVVIVTSVMNPDDAAFFRMSIDDDDEYYLTNIYNQDSMSINSNAYWCYAPEFDYPLVKAESEPAPALACIASGYKIVNGMVIKA